METGNNEKQSLTNEGYENDEVIEPSHISNKPSLHRALSRQATRKDIIFHDVCYTVPTKEKGIKIQKEILKNVSGILKPGLNAILGPTGSGKTSLLDVLAGRKDKRFLTGDVIVDGERQPDDFRLMSGYVVQEDIIMGTLTVEENLRFSADLRLPSTFSRQDRKERVQQVMEDLGLSGVANSRVGNEFKRGISGGEKKRTMIGMELITSPNILFLDEPTTGLDSATAYSVIALLKKQADAGKTVVFSIHQPRYSIFRLFDSVTLLSAGEIVYHGECSKGLDYFQSVGYECEKYNNPPDFILDVIAYDTTRKKMLESGLEEKEEIDYVSTGIGNISDEARKEPLSIVYNNSSLYENTIHEIKPTIDSVVDIESDDNVIVKKRNKAAYETSFFRQSRFQKYDPLTIAIGLFVYLYPLASNIMLVLYIFVNLSYKFGVVSWRNLLNIVRNPQLLISQSFIVAIFAVIVGVIYLQLDHGISGLQNRVGVLLFLTMNVVFSNIGAVQLFIQEKSVFRHESASGFYRVSSYFISKTICDILALRLLPTIMYACITYWMVGLVSSVSHFFIFSLVIFVTAICACSLAFFVSSSVRTFPVAQIFMILPTIIMLVFSGVFVNLNTMPSWLNWLKYLSLFRYALATLLINELKGMSFDCGTDPITHKPKPCISGDEYLASQGIDPADEWINIIAIAAITFAFMILAYIQLRRLKKFK